MFRGTTAKKVGDNITLCFCCDGFLSSIVKESLKRHNIYAVGVVKDPSEMAKSASLNDGALLKSHIWEMSHAMPCGDSSLW